MTLELHALTCERDDRILFQQLSVQVLPGQALRIAGPNGAGKTTLLRTIAGLFECQSGEVHWQGHALSASPEAVLYIGHGPQVSRDLTVQTNLECMTGLSAHALRPALQAVGLKGYGDSLVRELSQGQKRRVALARLWLESRPIWVLDEPYTALDVRMVERLDEQIRGHLAAGGICVFSTHQPPHQLSYQTVELGDGN